MSPTMYHLNRRMLALIIVLSLLLSLPLPALAIETPLNGHVISGNTVTFVFSEDFYEFDEPVTSVAIRGNFNDYDPTKPEWQLVSDGAGVWTLDAALGDQIIRGAPFAFVVNGEAVQPPEGVDADFLLPDSEGGFLLVVGGLKYVTENDAIISRFEHHVYETAQGYKLNYFLLSPKNYDPAKSYPLVVLLHGAGERGDSLAPILPYNGAYEFVKTAGDRDYFLLAPQLAEGVLWYSPLPVRALLGLIRETQAQFSINPKQIYASGLSLGGYGMWALPHTDPDLLAAGMSICGGDGSGIGMDHIAHIPFQVFHGSEDSMNPVTMSRDTVAALEAAGADVTYTEYEGADHWVWVRTYSNPDVIDWLFAQVKP